jgi:two-component system CheB/CheR fusion protein
MHADSGSQTKAWLSHLLGTASEHAVVFMDGSGQILAWLGAAEILFGYGKAEALQLDFADLFTPNDRRLQMDLQELAVARALGRSEDERWHVRKDGTFFWASGVVAAVNTPREGIEVFCKILRDRTDVRQQLDTQQNRVRAVQLDNRRKNRILESVGHQLRTLVGPMDEAAELLPGTEHESVLSRQVRTTLLLEMADLLQDAAKPAAGMLPEPGPRVKSIVLQEALKACIRGARQLVMEGGQQLHLLVPSVPLLLEADPAGLREMLQALLANALKQTPTGGNIHVLASVEGGHAVVRVIDDGAGMAGRRMAKVLLILSGPDGLTKLDESDAELAAMAGIAAMHGGSLEARSPGVGKGSQFCLRLPIAPLD